MKRRTHQPLKADFLFDILIVGGGITGTGVLLEAGKKGYNTVLIEKGDFASGTSSKSGKLAHGGLRYLQYGHFGLVREALKERDYLLNTYPHLVKPLRFLYPIYRTKLKFQFFLGLCVYQCLNIFSDLPGFKYFNRGKTLIKFPSLNKKKLKGSFMYFDAVTNDARLCSEIIHESINTHSTTALNYFELISFEKHEDKIKVMCFDHIEGKAVNITAKYMINASGPWLDELSQKIFSSTSRFTAPSKGTHIVLSRNTFPFDCSLLFSAKANDNRWLYSVPWENNTVLIGATDTDYSDQIDKAKVDIADDEYILNAINHIVPALNISRDDIISSFSGIRPLLRHEKISSKDRSREYKIWWTNDQVLNVFGGKLTGFRSMGEKSMNMIAKKCPIDSRPIQEKDHILNDIDFNELPEDFVKLIKEKYANESPKIFEICLEDPTAMDKLHNEFDIYLAEIIYFARHQSCYHIEDVLGRRLSLSYVMTKVKEQEEIVKKTADILKIECGWNEQEYVLEQKNYINLIKERNLYL